MDAILNQHTSYVISFIEKEYDITTSKEATKKVIKLPWIGKIVEDECKGLRFNGGLYTQCTQKCKEYCATCKKNKYGTVYDRLKKNIGEYRDMKGRKEINYMTYIKKNKISLKEAERECERVWGQKLPEKCVVVKHRGRPKKIQEVDDTDSDNEKKTRGRPKKTKTFVDLNDDILNTLITAQKEEEVVDCHEFHWENNIYWKDNEGNLYNSETKEHCGVYDIDHNIVTLYR